MDKRIIATIIVVEAVLFILIQYLYSSPKSFSPSPIAKGSGADCSYNVNISPLNIINIGSNTINVTIGWSICQLGFVINNYVAYTPDILAQHPILADGTNFPIKTRDNLTKYTIPLSFALLPILLTYYALRMSLAPLGSDEHYTPYRLLQKGMTTLLLIVALPFILSLLIQLNNAICKYIITVMITTTPQEYLSQQIGNAIQLSQVQSSMSNAIIPPIIETILYVLLLIALLIMVFQFVLRFILLWIFVIASPVLLMLRILPSCEKFIDTIIARFFLLLFLQPVFLVGLSVFFQITAAQLDDVSKLLMGATSLLSLSLLPGIMAGHMGNMTFSKGERIAMLQWQGILQRLTSLRPALQQKDFSA